MENTEKYRIARARHGTAAWLVFVFTVILECGKWSASLADEPDVADFILLLKESLEYPLIREMIFSPAQQTDFQDLVARGVEFLTKLGQDGSLVPEDRPTVEMLKEVATNVCYYANESHSLEQLYNEFGHI